MIFFWSVAVEQVESAHEKTLSCSVSQCVAVCCSVLQCVVVCCSVLQCDGVCVAECCSALQSIVLHVCTRSVATHCNALQHTAIHCNTKQHNAHNVTHTYAPSCENTHVCTQLLNQSHRDSGVHSTVCCSVLQCVAVCCSVLQCVAVCCSVLQCAAECGIVWQFVGVRQCEAIHCSVRQCDVAYVAYGSVLQCVAVHDSVLQVCCSVYVFHVCIMWIQIQSHEAVCCS